jgi:hypothetical protein
MGEVVSTAIPGVAALRIAVEEMAAALATADLDRLLACESPLEAALRQLPTRGLPAEARAAVRGEVEAARLALVRCRRLGRSLDAFIGAGLSARGLSGVYGPDAGPVRAPLHSLNLTV